MSRDSQGLIGNQACNQLAIPANTHSASARSTGESFWPAGNYPSLLASDLVIEALEARRAATDGASVIDHLKQARESSAEQRQLTRLDSSELFGSPLSSVRFQLQKGFFQARLTAKEEDRPSRWKDGLARSFVHCSTHCL